MQQKLIHFKTTILQFLKIKKVEIFSLPCSYATLSFKNFFALFFNLGL